jgi:hypothetical protein
VARFRRNIYFFEKNSNKKLCYFLAFLADMADLIKIGPNTDKEEEATEDFADGVCAINLLTINIIV